MMKTKYKVGDQVNYRSANGPILCRVTEHLPGYFDHGSTDGWKIVKVDGSGWAGKSSNNCSAKWLTPVTEPKPQRTLSRKDIVTAIENAVIVGRDYGSGKLKISETLEKKHTLIKELFQ